MARRTTVEPTLVAGIDLGGTNMSIGIVDPKGRIVGACKRKTKAHEGKDVVLDRIVEGLVRACAEAAIEPAELAAVGIGAPSAIDFDHGVVINAGNLGWKNVPLRDLLQQRLRVPVVVDNDVNVAAWGEATLGAGVGKGDLLAVWVGTGVGGGLVLNGGLWRGPLFTAGEIGQVILQPGGAPGHRTVEEFCSRTAIVRSMENDDPPPVSVANPTRRLCVSPMSNRPDPMKVFDVGQCTTLAPASASRAFSRAVRWMAWP